MYVVRSVTWPRRVRGGMGACETVGRFRFSAAYSMPSLGGRTRGRKWPTNVIAGMVTRLSRESVSNHKGARGPRGGPGKVGDTQFFF